MAASEPELEQGDWDSGQSGSAGRGQAPLRGKGSLSRQRLGIEPRPEQGPASLSVLQTRWHHPAWGAQAFPLWPPPQHALPYGEEPAHS